MLSFSLILYTFVQMWIYLLNVPLHPVSTFPLLFELIPDSKVSKESQLRVLSFLTAINYCSLLVFGSMGSELSLLV
jgi:hypothetical protein